MVLVVLLCALKVVLKHVTLCVSLLIVRVYVLCHVVQIYALEDQAMTVMVLRVMLVAEFLVAEIVLLVAHVEETVLLTDVIPHVIIGVIMCV